MVANDVAQGTAIGNYAAAKLGKKIAIIDDKTAYGVGLADETEKAVKAAGGTVVIREALANEKSRDFKGVLTKVKARTGRHHVRWYGRTGRPDAQADESPWHQGQSSSRATAHNLLSLIKLGGDAAEGSYATTAGLPKRDAAGAAFYDKFKASSTLTFRFTLRSPTTRPTC